MTGNTDTSSESVGAGEITVTLLGRHNYLTINNNLPYVQSSLIYTYAVTTEKTASRTSPGETSGLGMQDVRVYHYMYNNIYDSTMQQAIQLESNYQHQRMVALPLLLVVGLVHQCMGVAVGGSSSVGVAVHGFSTTVMIKVIIIDVLC